jgi:uncharacterized protein (TIGR03437 family)
MVTTRAAALILLLSAVKAAHAAVVTLESTIPSGNLSLQPPVLTGAASLFGSGGGVVLANAFTSPVNAALYQISVVVEFQPFPQSGVTGASPMLLTLLTDNNDSPGTPIESWTVPLSPSDLSLTLVTVTSVSNSMLLAGRQYWVSLVPTDPIHTGIGWGLTTPGTELPVARSNTGVNSGWAPAQLNLANEFSVSGNATPAISVSNPPLLYSAENSASYDATIAQGSLFVVYGSNIGPAQPVQAAAYPLASQLGGTAISVSSGGTTLTCPMVYSVAGAAAAILPSNTPPGTASVTLTYNGQAALFPTQVTVVPTAMGLYTLSSSGLGPGSFTALNGSLKTFASPAKAGDIVYAWGTGLGPITSPDAALPSAFPNFPGVEVFVGTLPATVLYAGRSGCCAGVDQISFGVPAGVSGCYVPVAVRSAGKISNFVSIAVSKDGGPCSDTAPTVPINIMNQAGAGQPVTASVFAIGPTSVLRGFGFDQRQYLAEKLSKLLHVKLSQEDVAKLLWASQIHDQRALRSGMRKYARSWKALDPSGKAAVAKVVNLTTEGAYAAFGRYGTPATLAAAVGGLFPSQGTCTVLTQLAAFGQRHSSGLDAGSSLALSGSAGTWTLTPSHTGQYQVMFGSSPTGPNVPPGTYTIAGSGGRGLSAFSASLTVTGNFSWSNKAAINTVNRNQPLTVTWTGGSNQAYVLIGGYFEGRTAGFVGFVCTEEAGKGSFTIPSFVLSALPPAPTGGAMFISPHPLSQPVTIPGLDFSYFVDGSSDSKSVVYQ